MATCPPFKGDANCVINKNTEFVNRDATGKEIFGMPKGVFDTKNMDNLVKCGVACANNVGFALGEAKVMENKCALPTWTWIPDGHVSVLKDSTGTKWMAFWSEFDNYRTIGDTPWLEDHCVRNPETSVFGGRKELGAYNSGGAWLQSVFRRSQQDKKKLIAFYHAEDRYDMSIDDCYKTVGCTTSDDDGLTWQDRGVFLTGQGAKPEKACFSGVGDQDVVWDFKHLRWVCFFTDPSGISMALSDHPQALPGTWYKYCDNKFTEPGMGGRHQRVEALAGPGGVSAGCNPSVHWNTFLQKWVMVWGSWQGKMWLSHSPDLLSWAAPQLIVEPKYGYRAWYPTIISAEGGDTVCGEKGKLYYADFKKEGGREMIVRDITFVRK